MDPSSERGPATMFYPPLIGYLLLAVVCVVLVLVIRGDRLPRNRAIGIRSALTLRSEASWKAGHRAAIPVLIIISIIAVGFSIALLSVEKFAWPKAVGAVLAVSGWLLILGLFVRVWTTANRAARSADD
ncbi:SdpI family protein [Brevibacterium sediminis]|uniref:SdpI family protein n=1 Tax=Brevibacterium sediminis TaxID=1857024 RepID=A0A5C4WTM2_9MICO|nr:SdpI family protein [Brevibacterium sediminis]MCS4593478.1 SdpI family protein [Brevibacterium sediminis]TNM51674.1 SdpI family protein [Brevibacterium sediminis]